MLKAMVQFLENKRAPSVVDVYEMHIRTYMIFALLFGCLILTGCRDSKVDLDKDDFESYTLTANKADQEAQYHLANCYASGKGTFQDLSEATALYRKAAEKGHAKAQYLLGYCYFEGAGVTKDKAEAVAWYRKAAEQDNVDAQRELGFCYQSGHGVKTDEALAFNWLSKASKNGDKKAQHRLAFFYGKGTVVKKDVIEAYAYFLISEQAQTLGSLIIIKGMTAEQITEGKKRAKVIREEIATNQSKN